MQKRWGPEVLRNDPYYNPNLSLVRRGLLLGVAAPSLLPLTEPRAPFSTPSR